MNHQQKLAFAGAVYLSGIAAICYAKGRWSKFHKDIKTDEPSFFFLCGLWPIVTVLAIIALPIAAFVCFCGWLVGAGEKNRYHAADRARRIR